MIDVEAIAAYTAAVIRARREYAIHPFAYCIHAGRCPKP